MSSERLRASLIVRVIDIGGGRRIVVHDLRTREVWTFSSWPDAMRLLVRAGEGRGLR